MHREFAAENARRRNAANRDARLAWLTVQMWASTTAHRKVPSLDRYLVHATSAPPTAEAKARQHLIALQTLSAQFGIPMRQGGKPL